ncbi:MAG TPA: hypothetical protein VKA32_01415 [Gammaproteobacteria bacterium]|nr:hypothetical protein [Gammaproteobacteria bacterium]
MNDKTAAGDKPAGDAVPESRGGFVNTAKRDHAKADDAVDHLIAAIERWYADHFHRAAINGTQPITADDKAALIAHVSDAANSTPKE